MGGGFPRWLVKRLPACSQSAVPDVLHDLHLATVCREAHCPNRAECYAAGTATFLVMGTVCTRNCRFCAVEKGKPRPIDPDEPRRVAEAARRMGLRFVVVTSVTRDDLPDGGAGHFAEVVRAVKGIGAKVEVLVPDFRGDERAVQQVLAAGPDVFNHNVETVPRLYGEVRPMADYARSLSVLRCASEHGALAKSGFMVGLGETQDEVLAVLADLRAAGVAIVSIGQYLKPGGSNLRIEEFVRPEVFDEYAAAARRLGFRAVASGPFVRSSYRAGLLADEALRTTI
jgi:lipoic acid synthetase